MAKVGFEGGAVAVFGEVVCGVGVACGVWPAGEACGAACVLGFVAPVARDDGVCGGVGAGGCEPCGEGGFNFDVSDLCGFGVGGGNVNEAVADVAPGEAGEFHWAYAGKEEDGEGCDAVCGGVLHEASGFGWGVYVYDVFLG